MKLRTFLVFFFSYSIAKAQLSGCCCVREEDFFEYGEILGDSSKFPPQSGKFHVSCFARNGRMMQLNETMELSNGRLTWRQDEIIMMQTKIETITGYSPPNFSLCEWHFKGDIWEYNYHFQAYSNDCYVAEVFMRKIGKKKFKRKGRRLMSLM